MKLHTLYVRTAIITVIATQLGVVEETVLEVEAGYICCKAIPDSHLSSTQEDGRE